jgi:perosamine synthetase
VIRLTVPSIDEADLEAVRSTVASGFLVQGKQVVEFEKLVADKVGVQHAIAVANGTCALHLALCVLGVKPGDICVVPAYSWVATANVVEHCGARPVFVDIDARTFNIDVEKFEETLRSLMDNPATASLVKAVIPVHAFGLMADMRAINEICARWNIPVVEDAACALGASLHGQQAGSWGTMGCFSFHPRKAVTTGEGGAVTTNEMKTSSTLRALRNHGQDPDATTQDFISAGFNYRLTEFQGALGVVQMSKLDRIVAKRVAAASRYDAILAGSVLELPCVVPGSCHVYQSYVTLLPEEHAARRAALISAAREAGIELQIGTIHMPMTTFYRRLYGFKAGDFAVTDSVSARALALPLYENISEDDQQSVARFLLASLS